MRWGAVLVVGVCVAVALSGCLGSEGAATVTATRTATAEPTDTPAAPPIDILPTMTATPTPTPTPLPPAAAGAIWTFDLGRGKHRVLYEGDEALTSRVEASGNGVTAAVVRDGVSTAMRFQPDGEHLEEFDQRGMMVSSANGESRFYLDLTDPADPDLVLESRGERVPLEGTRARVGVAFSPSGDRLLTMSVRPAEEAGEEVRTFSVHTTKDGRLRMQFEHRAVSGAPAQAIWSPSGRYVADQGVEGLFVRDTVSGNAWYLGPGGSPRWSPEGDRVLAITLQGNLSVVSIPDLSAVDLGPFDVEATVLFDRSGRFAIATSYADAETRAEPTTRAFDVETGSEVASWPGMDTSVGTIGGFDPVVTGENGFAAVFAAASGCDDGFVIVHQGLEAGGRCVRGTNPRWSPKAELLVFARDREIVMYSVASDSERVIARGTPPADTEHGPLLRWSPDGSWILIQWPWLPADYLSIVR